MTQQIRPSTAEELREIVASAAADETPLEILGAGTKRGYGRPVEAKAQVVLDGLCGIGLYEPAELVMSAQVGTPLAEIEARLADNQQQLAFEPPDYGALLGGEPGRGTIGGVIACNLSGPRRIKAGAARDHFLGVQAVTGRGDAIKSGGRVVKNVTGYDLCKLFAGSFGTLVAMTEVTFKVLPAAEHEATLCCCARTRAAGFAALRRAMNSAGDVAGAAYLPAAAAARSSVPAIAAGGADLAALRLEGPAPSVRARVEASRRCSPTRASWMSCRPRRAPRSGARSAMWPCCRRRAAVAGLGAACGRRAAARGAGARARARLAGRLGRRSLWLAVESADDAGAAAIRRASRRLAVTPRWCGPAPSCALRLPVFQPQEPALARLSARVKDSFDPKRILNRGRMYAQV